jgi:hypothetical protein
MALAITGKMKKISVITSSVAFAGFCLLVFSCSNEPKEEIPAKEPVFSGFHFSLDSIIRVKEGVVHGFELGDSAKAVKAYEPGKPEEEDSDYVLYSYPIDSVSRYTIAYTFAKDTLEEAEIQISSSIDAGTEIFNNLKKYYSEKHTAPLLDKGIYVFNCYDGNKRNFKISLTDNSTSETGIINMLVYREK